MPLTDRLGNSSVSCGLNQLSNTPNAIGHDRAKGKDHEMVPAAIADRLLNSENLIRIKRAHRHLTQDKLAIKAVIAKPYLS